MDQSVSTILGSLQRSAVDSSVASSNTHFTSYSQPFAPFSAMRAFFPPALAGLSGGGRKERLALLASVTDLYMWILLRRRHGLSRAATCPGWLDR